MVKFIHLLGTLSEFIRILTVYDLYNGHIDDYGNIQGYLFGIFYWRRNLFRALIGNSGLNSLHFNNVLGCEDD